MAEEFKQLQDSPIIRTQNISSKAKGLEDLSKVFGGISKASIGKATEMAEEQSSIMYLQSRNQIEDVLTSTQVEMLKNPGMSAQIAKATRETLDTISDATMVNKKDRTALESSISKAHNSVILESTKIQVDQTHRMSQFAFMSSFPSTLKAYQDALIANDPHAEQLHNKTLSAIRGMVSSGILSPSQGASAFKAMDESLETVKDFQSLPGQDVTAKQYNHAAANLIEPGSPEIANLPVNESTRHLTQMRVSDNSAEGMYSRIDQGFKPTVQQWFNADASTRNKAKLMMQGTARAKSYVLAHEPYPVIANRLNELNSRNIAWSYDEKAEAAYLTKFKKQLDDGQALQVIEATPMGMQNKNDYIRAESALRSAPGKPNEIALQSQKNYNDYVHNNKAIMDAMHLPKGAVQPIPDNIIKQVQSAFSVGGDPATALHLLAYHDAPNRAYLAYSMETPLQQEVMQTANLLHDDQDLAFKEKLITYNQKLGRTKEGQKETSLSLGEKGESDQSIRNQILSNGDIQNILTYKSKYGDAVVNNEAFMTMALNYVKGEALANGDLKLDNLKQYIKDFSKVSKGYETVSGANFVFNKKILDIPQHEAQLITNDIIEHINKKLEKKYGDRYLDMIDRNPYFITVTPDRNIVALDQNKQIIYSEPYAPQIAVRASHSHNERIKKINESMPPKNVIEKEEQLRGQLR